jgi:hypothetical protein
MRKSAFQTILLAGISAAFLISGQTAFADPNLISWWKFDEGSGSTAYDSAGSNNGNITGATWTMGQINGALSFDGSNDYVALSSFTVSTNNGTISLWFKTSADFTANYGGQGHLINRNDLYYSYLAVVGNGTVPYKMVGETDSQNDYFVNIEGVATVGAWNHIAVSFYNKQAKTYLNGELLQTKTISNSSLTLNRIGGITQEYFNGKIDDVRIYNRALSAGEIWQICREGFDGKAFAPHPTDGATGVDPNVVLSWSPGKEADSHDVYFGTNYNDVNDANMFSPEYQGNFDVNHWDPCGLDICTTYYWRIDEVNEPNIWKGNVWSYETSWPVIGLSATQFEFYAIYGSANPADQILGIFNGGVGILNWQISEDCSWLSVEPNSGSSIGETNDVNLSVDISGLPMGIYTCNLTISDPNAFNNPQVVSVNLHVGGIISWWKFDEGNGTIAYDSKGSNDGTITGATWTTGQINGALSFDGDSDYVLVGDKDNLEQQEFTLSFWAQLNNPSGSLQGGIAKGWIFGDAKMFSYTLDFSGGNARAAVTNTSDTGFSITGPILNSDWHMWTMTVGGGTITLYKDGSDVNSTGYTGMIDYRKWYENFVIGARDNGDYAFNGKIDDVRFYNRTLSAEEIEQLCQIGFAGKAYAPNPVDGATGVDTNVVLSWSPGKDATSHDVYLGTDYNDVNYANIFSPEYQGNFDVNYWDPCGLDICTTYYWRIDEVNEPNLWKGDVWSFITPSPVIELSATQFQFIATEGGANPDDQILGISNSGAVILNWHISEDCNWLSLEPNSGSSTGEVDDVNLSVDTSALSEGYYDCNLSVWDSNAANSPRSVHIKLLVYIEGQTDFGDAPDPNYPTLLASGGPCHVAFGPILGANRDTELDGQPNATAIGDDIAGAVAYPPGDEDGITNIRATGWASGGATVTVTVTNGPAYLSGWIDWNQDGSWAETEDLVVNNVLVPSGTTVLPLTGAPGAALNGGQIFSRWRLSTAGGLTYTGIAADGEVEDYNKVECSCLGDVLGSGRVYASDISQIATWIAAYGSGRPKTILASSPYFKPCADTTRDGKITASDISKISTWIAAYGVGLPPSVKCPHSYP